MFKRFIYAVAVIAVLSFVVSCSNDSNSVSGPTEPGFEISNLKYSTQIKQNSKGEDYLSIDNISVNYKGAQGGIKNCVISATAPSKDSTPACMSQTEQGKYNASDGVFQVDGDCRITKRPGTTVNGSTVFSIKLIDGNQKTSNTLTDTISVNF